MNHPNRGPPARRVSIVIDVREHASPVPAFLARREEVLIRWRQLAVGDYLAGRDVVVERKSVQDFAQSLVDGRLFSQAARLRQCPARPVFVVEGPNLLAPGRGIDRNALLGALVSLSVSWYIPILRSRDPEETARILLMLANQSLRAFSIVSRRPGYRPKPAIKRRLFILQGLPGVGPVIARRLIGQFRTIESIMAAGEDALATVKGVGRKRARLIREIVAGI